MGLLDNFIKSIFIVMLIKPSIISINFKLAIFTVLVIGCFFSCKKEEGIKEGSRLKTVLHFTGSTIDSFIYDNQQRLIGIKTFGGFSNYENSIEYNAQGKLAKVVISYRGIDAYQSDYIYNGAGQIIRRIFTTPGFVDGSAYAYDSQGRLIADTTYNQQTGDKINYLSYTYNNQGNIIEEEYTDFLVPQNNRKTSFKFDSNPSPYKFDGNLLYYIRGGGSQKLNKNNYTEMKPSWSTARTIQYEYQKNGLPTKITTPLPNDTKDLVMLEYW
ncbi:MAG: hypothetical protein J7502_03580 [Flavisolibacter sp.]|nr:hypothetical protein [Flavisolibacter sp.]